MWSNRKRVVAKILAFYMGLNMGKKLSFFLLLAIIGIGSVNAQIQNQKCAQNGEYCLTHNDCCSGSCLSFSYKCVPVPPSVSFGTTLVPVQSSTIDTANRFGGDDGGASLTQKTCALNGEYCLTHVECCSGSCLSFSYKCVPLSQAGSTLAGSQDSAQSTLSFSNRVGEESTTVFTKTTASSATTPKQCAGIGEYCLTPNDCCSGSCLSFSYKCVTNHQLKLPAPSNTITAVENGFANRFGGSGNSNINTEKCAAVGEYCLTSSECCSKSCLSFAYKCVNRYDLASAPGQIATTPIAVENRFGESSSSIAGTVNRQCTSNGLYCFHNQECCSGACFKSICSTEIRLGVPESELTQPSVSNGPFVLVKDLDDLINRFGGETQAKQQAGGRQALMCKEAGDTCARHEDCCTRNCHSYRRKCVN